MSKRMYEKGRKITSIEDFASCQSEWYWCFGGSTRHRTVLENQQYSTLMKMISNGHLYTAKKIGKEERDRI